MPSSVFSTRTFISMFPFSLHNHPLLAHQSSSSADMGSALPTVCHLALTSDTPVEQCTLKLHVIVREPNGARRVITDEDDESVRCRWLKGQRRMCAAPQCRAAAKLQCVPCAQQLALFAAQTAKASASGGAARAPPEAAIETLTAASFYCSNECLAIGWPQHKQMHARASAAAAAAAAAQQAQAQAASSAAPTALTAPAWTCDECPEDLSLPALDNELPTMYPLPGDAAASAPSAAETASLLRCRFAPPLANVWSEAATTRTFTPSTDDVGRALRFEVTPVLPAPLGAAALAAIPPPHLDSANGVVLGPRAALETQPTLAAPLPPPPRVFTYCAPPETHGHTCVTESFHCSDICLCLLFVCLCLFGCLSR